jgi:hypothetical protein
MNAAWVDETQSERPSLLSDAFDPCTLRWLSPRVQPEDHCLVVGAGAGSVARLLEQAAGPEGRVVPLETHPKSWCQVSSESPQIPALVLHELTNGLGPFDVVHVRFALVHAQNKDELLSALVAAVRPGGLLVVEEPDFGSARALTGQEKARRSFNNVHSAMELVFATLRLDHAVGSRIPELLQQYGLENISIENDAAILPGQSHLGHVMAMSATQLATALIATGFASPNDIERYRDFASDPTCWATYVSIIRGAGVRPVG